MARNTNKKRAEEVRQLWQKADTPLRRKWQFMMQKCQDFFSGEQIADKELKQIEEAGMPTFIINRILPVIETMKFFVTSGNPRWQAVGAEGSDTDIAAVHSDMLDYCWYQSNGKSLYSQVIQDSLVRGCGFFMVDVDSDADRGMGEVVFKRIDPFDVYVDPMSRDFLFRDASYIMVKKNMSKEQLKRLLPGFKNKITRAEGTPELRSFSDKDTNKDFHAITGEDIGYEAYTKDGSMDEIIDFYECYRKVKQEFSNVFRRVPPTREQMIEIDTQISQQIADMQEEFQVQMAEAQVGFQKQIEAEEMLPERAELELKKMQEEFQQQVQQTQITLRDEAIQKASQVENKIMTKEDFEAAMKVKAWAKDVVEAVPFYDSRVALTCVAGDQLLYDYILNVSEYPIVPISYQYSGTPYPQSAVHPLVGKQQEINKAHQIMVHNANLSSNLRWLYPEGSIPEEEWELYSSSPGALLKYRQGFEPPTPVQPLPLNNAFYSITQEAKQDMEYISGISSAMQGVTGAEHETYRGMLALDEFGTRRLKAWMQGIVEPALEHLGRVFTQISQDTYSAQKVFRIVQPNGKQEKSEINVPIYNDFGEVIGKFNDYQSARFDIRMVGGSTMPVNRWALIEEYFKWFQAGLIDDIAMLQETDIRNKEQVVQRKSLYAQLQSQLAQMEESVKDKEGTIETLERQLVQAGIKMKVKEGSELVDKEVLQTQQEQRLARNTIQNEIKTATKEMKLAVQDKKRKSVEK